MLPGHDISLSKPNTDGSIHLKKTPSRRQNSTGRHCRQLMQNVLESIVLSEKQEVLFPPFFWPQIDDTLSAFTSFCCSFLAVISPGLQSREGQYLPMDRMSSSSTSMCVFSLVRPLDISYKLTTFMFGCTCEWPVMSVEQF